MKNIMKNILVGLSIIVAMVFIGAVMWWVVTGPYNVIIMVSFIVLAVSYMIGKSVLS